MKAIKTIFELDQIKGLFFLATLPNIIDNTINNLNTKGITQYNNIKPKILNIANRNLYTEPQVVYYISITQRQPPTINITKRLPPTAQNKYTQYRKHDLMFIGYIYTNYRALQKYKANQKKGY